MALTNRNKWLIAVPYTVVATVILPAAVVRDLLWFTRDWIHGLFMILSSSIWLIATGFVDVTRPRGPRDTANLLIPLGLILAVPVAVWDRTCGIVSTMTVRLHGVGILISISAYILGMASRRSLARSYTPRPSHTPEGELVKRGPYRWIRHPMYLAAILWVLGWPLIEGSILASVLANAVVLPAIIKRIEKEEADLVAVYGEAYLEYQGSTWRLVPYVY